MANYCRLLSQRCVYGFNVNWCSSDIIQMTLNEKILDSSAHCRSWLIFLSWVWFSLRLWKPRKIKESREDMSPLMELRYYVNPNVPWGSGILRLGWFVAVFAVFNSRLVLRWSAWPSKVTLNMASLPRRRSEGFHAWDRDPHVTKPEEPLRRRLQRGA